MSRIFRLGRGEAVSDRRGAILMIVLILVVAVGALATGFLAIADLYARSSGDSFELEQATFAAESGLAYYMARLLQDPDYLVDRPAPHTERQIGESTFELEIANPGMTGDQWLVVCVGRDGDQEHRVSTVLGRDRIDTPDGIVIAGMGEPTAVALEIGKNTSVGKYDSLTGNLDINIVGDAVISVDGSLKLKGASEIYADVITTGMVYGGSGDEIQGSLSENAPEITVDNIDAIINELTQRSLNSNDNDVLLETFAHEASVGPDSTLDFNAKKGTYIFPTGVYRFRNFQLNDKATVIFDTQNGSSTLICLGDGGKKRGLRIDDEASIVIDPGTTQNGLLTVLGPDCDLDVDHESVFGSVTIAGDTVTSSAFSRIVGPSNATGKIKIYTESMIYGHLHTAGHELDLYESTWYGSGVLRKATIESGLFVLFGAEEANANADGQGAYDALAQWTPSPIELSLLALAGDVVELGLSLSQERQLTGKIEQAREHCARGQLSVAANQVGQFVNQVDAQRGGGLTDAQADALIATANAIIAQLQAT